MNLIMFRFTHKSSSMYMYNKNDLLNTNRYRKKGEGRGLEGKGRGGEGRGGEGRGGEGRGEGVGEGRGKGKGGGREGK